MPYSSNDALPSKIKSIVPDDHAQTIFRSAFNSILGSGKSEARAFAMAYGALKNAGYKRGEDGKYTKISKCPHMNGDLHHGVMIAFKLDEGLTKALALGYGQYIDTTSTRPMPPDEMHITLFYLGKFEDVSLSQLAAAEEVLDSFTADRGPVKASIGGVGRFPATEHSDFKDVAYVPVMSADLLKFRDELATALKAKGVEFSENFESYTPHITLAYIDQSAATPTPRVQHAEITLEDIIFQVGPIGKEFNLETTDEEPVEKAMKDAPNYRQAEDRGETCSSCIHGGDGYCDLYSFNYNTRYVCNSWEPLEAKLEKHVPPVAVQTKAKKALEVFKNKEEGQRGLGNGMYALASKLANGTAIDPDEIQNMVRFFGTMSKGQGDAWANNGPDYQNWFGMGGNAGRSWSLKVQRKALSKISITTPISKIDNDKMQAFGWASTIEKDGQIVTDLQKHQMSEDELEKAAYRFVKNVRKAGNMHQKVGVGDLIESIVFTKAKQEALGIDLGRVGWWVGWQVTDHGTWDQVKKGILKEFSIHGYGLLTPVEETV